MGEFYNFCFLGKELCNGRQIEYLYNRMKRLFLLAAVLLCSVGLGAQEIRSVDIDVYLNEEGDAYIQQRWDVTVVRGTEWYIPIENLNGSEVLGLEVEENGVAFESDGRKWDSSRSLSEKAGRCGIIDKGSKGVELCWGQGSLGDHLWTAGFVVTGLVQSLEDYDAFNFMFVNRDLIANPQHASICFHRLDEKPFTEEETRFWVFGCEGEATLREDGTVFFETDRSMRSGGSLIVMMRFEKGIFHSQNVKDIKFAKMQKKAFRGSDYKQKPKVSFEDILGYIIGGSFVLICLLAVLGIIFLIIRDLFLLLIGRTWKKGVFGSSRPGGWNREAPFGGSIPIATWLLKDGTRLTFKGDHPERRIGAYFLKWIADGTVTPVKAVDGHYDLAFPEKAPEFKDGCESHLYNKAVEAAGANRILENGEFKAWANKHSTSLVNWPKMVEKEGKAALAAYPGDKVSEAGKLLQFKNFLSEFTLAKEREVPEVGLWGQYLVFAQLFGIADKVSAGLSKLYPDQFAEFSRSYGMESQMMSSLLHSWTINANDAYKTAYNRQMESSSSSSRSSGFGGHSSFGGGGGFSGGGFGGGSR